MPGEEEAIVASKLREDLDRLTHENDILREIVLQHAPDHVPLTILEEISKAQEAHRQEDLDRLKATLLRLMRDPQTHPSHLFGYAGDLKKVLNADPKKPLLDQLGFDPDAY